MTDETKHYTAAGFDLTSTADPTKHIQSAMLIGFKSGYVAAAQDVASMVKRYMARCRQSNVRALIDASDMLGSLERMAERPPVPGVVEMKPGETAEQAEARAGKETPRG